MARLRVEVNRSGVGATLLVVALVAFSSCRPPERTIRGATAILEVINPNDGAYEIFMDGQRLGRVAPAARARFRNLPEGLVTLQAEPVSDGPAWLQELSLYAEAPVGCLLGGPDPTRPMPGGFGSIAVANDLGRDVELRLDGRRIGTLFTDERRVIANVPVGEYRAEAVTLTEDQRFSRLLDVLEDTITAWQVTAPMGAVEVRNGWEEPVVVKLSGREMGVVAPGGAGVYPLRFEGRETVEVVGRLSGAVVRDDVVVVRDEVSVFALADRDGGIVIENHAQESLVIALDGRAYGVVRPLDTLRIPAVTPGVRRVEVAGAETGMRLFRSLRVGGGEEVRWRVDPRFGTLRVVNASPEPQRLYVDGHHTRTLPPGGSARLESIAAGAHTVAAVGGLSGVRYDHPVHVGPHASPLWVIEGATGAIAVHNARAESVRVYVDAVPSGVVESGQRFHVAPVSVGVRLVESVGLETGQVARDRVRVAEGHTGRVDIRDLRGLLVIRNHSGEAIETGPPLAAQVGVIHSDEQSTFSLPPGPRTLTVRGRDSRFAYRLDVSLEDGGIVEWTIAPPVARFTVFNRAGEDMDVSVGGVSFGVLPADGDMVIPALPAGRHTIAVEGRSSGALLERQLALGPEARGTWELMPQLARLRVHNGTSEPLDLMMDGQPYGRVEPGSMIGVGGIIPGAHRFVARGVRSGLRYESTIAVSPRRAGLWEIVPAEGTVLVTTARETPHRVFVDEREVGRSEGVGSPVVTAAPAGAHALAVTPEDDGAVHREILRIPPERTTVFHVPPRALAIEVVNPNPFAVRVQHEGYHLGEIPAGSTETLPGLAPEEALVLSATGVEGQALWRRTFRLVPPEDADPREPAAVWVLEPLDNARPQALNGGPTP